VRILTILGTRPEIIRLSLIIKKLDVFADKHILVHTGQNFTCSLSGVFFEELDIRKPDYVLKDRQQSFGEQLSTIFLEIEKIILREKPNKVLVLGDTNSALSAVLAERMGVPVVHMEAGNRCFDLRVPEEKNRRVIDAISTLNLPYTPQSKENLLREGIPVHKIMISGNPIYEVLEHYEDKIARSTILTKLSLEKQNYFLVTVHRAENVDYPEHLQGIFKGLILVAKTFQKRMICSIHPRTRSKLTREIEVEAKGLLEFYEPFSFFDFVSLEKNAFCTLTDSGTVQEESCLFHVPTVTFRNSTERPETVDCGSNIISGTTAENILTCVKTMVQQPTDWRIPKGYDDPDVSTKVIKLLLGGQRYV
jgi:UDP-N-acetylglucosamine 2-epimerase (non-hydrolysing)